MVLRTLRYLSGVIPAIALLVAPAHAQTRYDTAALGGPGAWSVIVHNGRPAIAHIQLGSSYPAIQQLGPESAPPGALRVALDHQMTFVHDSRPCAVGASVLWSVNGECSGHILGNIPPGGTFTTNRPFSIQTVPTCGTAHIYRWVVGYHNPAMLPCGFSYTRPPDIIVSIFDVRLR